MKIDAFVFIFFQKHDFFQLFCQPEHWWGLRSSKSSQLGWLKRKKAYFWKR
jgi:hypothetical protein